MKFNRIVFWQMNPSPHQAPWIRALSRLIPDCQIVSVFQKEVSPERIALGWQPPNYGDVQIINNPSTLEANGLLNTKPLESVHVFSAMMADTHINAAFNKALASNVRVGLLSEGRDWRGYKGLIRQVDAIRYERKCKKRTDFVLAIGQTGARWYEKCGYTREKIFPFAYVVEAPEGSDIPPNQSKHFEIIALGQLIFRKRFDLVLHALKGCSYPDWQLKIIGDGELRKELEQLVKDLGFEQKVVFTGVLDNIKVRRELELCDLMVLPSRWDGWGAVVNEALMSGVPIICSDHCGAADLIDPGVNGQVFKCNSVTSLTEKLNEQISRGKPSVTARSDLRAWANCINGENVARYFMDILNHCAGKQARPQAPWVNK